MSYFVPKKYVKDESYDPIYSPVNNYFYKRLRVAPGIALFLSLFLVITQIVFPLVFFKSNNKTTQNVEATALGKVSGFYEFEFSELETSEYESVKEEVQIAKILGTTTVINKPNEEDAVTEINTETKDSPQQNISQTQDLPSLKEKKTETGYFYLSIPKLNISEALVEINAPDLQPDEAVGHYAGSGLPGQKNKNMLLYGHSVLPFFYNPNNYKTIFSTLHTLQEGDEIIVTYKNKKYVYEVENKREDKPENIDPLANFKPTYLNESTLTLLTCSPPGTKIRRLMIDAVLVN